MKCCTKLETAKERCPIVFQGHPSNFKVTRDKTSPILTQIGRFRTIGRSQLSNPSDLPCYFMCGITAGSSQLFRYRMFMIISLWLKKLIYLPQIVMIQMLPSCAVVLSVMYICRNTCLLLWDNFVLLLWIPNSICMRRQIVWDDSSFIMASYGLLCKEIKPAN